MKINYLNDIANIRKAFSDIIIDSIVVSDEKSISWKNYIPGISKKLYSREYEHLKDTRQYSMILDNKGLLQFYYSFTDDVLEKAKLSYYPFPVKLHETDDDVDIYLSETDDTLIGEYYFDLWSLFQAEFGKNVNDEEIESLKITLEKLGQSELEALESKFNKKYFITNTSHIRIDYDSKVLSHNKVEIQFSSLNSIRIPLNKFISPFIFMDFIIRNEYSEWYEKHKNKHEYKVFYGIALKNSTNVQNFSHDNIFASHV